ncbi:MAG TPA: hypothetical protein VKU01_12210 [Bryobacteraceae bacterium]|nr:hypothetical protein [Bryobacteraceae bacterium]
MYHQDKSANFDMQETSTLEQTASADLWRNTLAPMPSEFTRLVYLAGLLDRNTGKYQHHGLALDHGADEAHNALRRAHGKVFSDFQALPLDAQKADVDVYLSTVPGIKRAKIEEWATRTTYRNLPPLNSRARTLFVAEFAAIVASLKNEYGVS